jgi:outer membrane protein insertion porin family
MKIDKSDATAGASNGDILERDTLLLNGFYYDHGYVAVNIDTPKLEAATDGPFIDIRIHIDEGARYRIGKLTIDEVDANGNRVAPFGGKKLRDRISARDGDWFSRAMLVRDLGSIRHLYRDAGFAAVEAEPETNLDPAHALVDVVIPVRRGPLVYIDRIVVVGNQSVPSATVKTGSPPRTRTGGVTRPSR